MAWLRSKDQISYSIEGIRTSSNIRMKVLNIWHDSQPKEVESIRVPTRHDRDGRCDGVEGVVIPAGIDEESSLNLIQTNETAFAQDGNVVRCPMAVIPIISFIHSTGVVKPCEMGHDGKVGAGSGRQPGADHFHVAPMSDSVK